VRRFSSIKCHDNEIPLFYFTFTFAQQTQFVDFKSVQGKIAVNSIEKTVSGDVNYFLCFEIY
jgi:hypothetical protein